MTAESLRDAYGNTLVDIGMAHDDLVVLDADLSSSTRTSIFGKAFPDRFFNMGIFTTALSPRAAIFKPCFTIFS